MPFEEWKEEFWGSWLKKRFNVEGVSKEAFVNKQTPNLSKKKLKKINKTLVREKILINK